VCFMAVGAGGAGGAGARKAPAGVGRRGWSIFIIASYNTAA